MDNNGNFGYYIAIGIIYLLSRIFGKKKKQVKKQGSTGTVTPPTLEKESASPMSFQDILRELSGVPQPKAVPETKAEPVVPTLDGSNFEPKDTPYQVDEMDKIAVDYKVPKPLGSQKLKESYLAKADMRHDTFERADNFKIKTKRSIDYLSMLGEEDGPAKAFVLSEIFNRKYNNY